MRRTILRPLTAGLVAITAAGLVAATASARSGAVPAPTSTPTLQGQAAQPLVGDKLTVTNGAWSGSPTKYAYQWDRCDSAGASCVPIASATAQSYTAATADIDHTLQANVLATNADGTGKADAKATGVVAARTTPKNTVRPTISGKLAVGETLTVDNGTWTGAGTFSYQWQQCDQNGNNCADIDGATGKSYGVRANDVGRELLARVKVTNRLGSTTADTDRTVPVTATPAQTTTTVVTVAGNQAPTITFLSLKRVGNKLYARFRTCDDSRGTVKVTERDNKARALSYTRRFAVTCGTYARNWKLLPRFRSSAGRVVVTLRASDSHGKLSRLVSRGIVIH
jgi:hypothetical protein